MQGQWSIGYDSMSQPCPLYPARLCATKPIYTLTYEQDRNQRISHIIKKHWSKRSRRWLISNLFCHSTWLWLVLYLLTFQSDLHVFPVPIVLYIYTYIHQLSTMLHSSGLCSLRKQYLQQPTCQFNQNLFQRDDLNSSIERPYMVSSLVNSFFLKNKFVNPF